jgi:septal ring factor EnvC (AmiA/AmiB activator)
LFLPDLGWLWSGDHQSSREEHTHREPAKVHQQISTTAEPMTANGQSRWPPTGSFVTAYGQDLMAADTLNASD